MAMMDRGQTEEASRDIKDKIPFIVGASMGMLIVLLAIVMVVSNRNRSRAAGAGEELKDVATNTPTGGSRETTQSSEHSTKSCSTETSYTLNDGELPVVVRNDSEYMSCMEELHLAID